MVTCITSGILKWGIESGEELRQHRACEVRILKWGIERGILPDGVGRYPLLRILKWGIEIGEQARFNSLFLTPRILKWGIEIIGAWRFTANRNHRILKWGIEMVAIAIILGVFYLAYPKMRNWNETRGLWCWLERRILKWGIEIYFLAVSPRRTRLYPKMRNWNHLHSPTYLPEEAGILKWGIEILDDNRPEKGCQIRILKWGIEIRLQWTLCHSSLVVS